MENIDEKIEKCIKVYPYLIFSIKLCKALN